eukprot:g3638.t1
MLPVLNYSSNDKEWQKALQQGAFILFLSEADSKKLKATNVFSSLDNYFSQPLDEKLKDTYENSFCFRGYMACGKEKTAGIVDEREQIEFARDYPSNLINPKASTYYHRLRGVNQWPDKATNPDFKPAVMSTFKLMRKIGRNVVQKIEQLHPDIFTSTLQPAFSSSQLGQDDGSTPFADGLTTPYTDDKVNSSDIRVNKEIQKNYLDHWQAKVTCTPNILQSGSSCGAHTDSGLLTLLLIHQKEQDIIKSSTLGSAKGSLHHHTDKNDCEKDKDYCGKDASLSQEARCELQVYDAETRRWISAEETIANSPEFLQGQRIGIAIVLGEVLHLCAQNIATEENDIVSCRAALHRVIATKDHKRKGRSTVCTTGSTSTKATSHKNSQNSTMSRRYSLAYFLNPSLDTIVIPSSNLHSTREKDGSGGVMELEYGANAWKSLSRSHPQIISLYHTDIVEKAKL